MKIKEMLQGVIGQEDLLNYYNVSLSYEVLPHGVRGFVFNHDGIYFIILDRYMCSKKRKLTLIHELAHIELNHLQQCNKDLFEFYIDGYEDEANEYIDNLLTNFSEF